MWRNLVENFSKFQAQKAGIAAGLEYLKSEYDEVTVSIQLPWQQTTYRIIANKLQKITYTESTDFVITEPGSPKLSERLLHYYSDLLLIHSSTDFTPPHYPSDQTVIDVSRIIRNIIEKPQSDEVSGKTSGPFGVDIGFWVAGKFRGSMIDFGDTYEAAAISATHKTLRDQRFKPLTNSERSTLDIECTFFSKLVMPVSNWEIAHSQTMNSHTYHARQAKTDAEGWFAPIVFNCVSIPSLKQLTSKLATQKLRPKTTDLIRVTQRESAGFVVSHSGGTSRLQGPLVSTDQRTDLDKITTAFKTAADWTARTTEDSGYIRPIITIEKRTSPAFDPPRTAFSAYALALACRHFNNPEYAILAQQMLSYADAHIDRFNDQTTALTYAYMSQAFHALDHGDKSTDYAKRALSLHKKNGFENTIARSQIAKALKQQNLDAWHEMYQSLFKKFQTQVQIGEAMSLAKFPELLTLSKVKRYQNDHEILLQWYINQQHWNGSFPNTTTDTHSYVRGTGKIVESLTEVTVDPIVLEPAFEWLLPYQYTSQSMFHIPTTLRSQISGGFRHDAFNRDVWIDSAAHVMVASYHFLNPKIQAEQ